MADLLVAAGIVGFCVCLLLLALSGLQWDEREDR